MPALLSPIDRLSPLLHATLCLLLLAAALFGCRELVGMEQQKRAWQMDLAEISHAKYGLLNVDAWEARLGAILQKKVAEFDLSPDGGAELRPRIEGLIVEMIDRIAQIVRDTNRRQGGASGWFKQHAFELVINVDQVKRDAPRLAEDFVHYLQDPANRANLGGVMAEQLHRYARQSGSEVDYTLHDAIVARHGAGDAEQTRALLASRIAEASQRSRPFAGGVLIASLGLLALAWRRPERLPLATLLLLSLALLAVGLWLPMIDIEARITRLSFALVGETLEFRDQVLFFQSKSILEVVGILFGGRDPKLMVTGGLIFLFSVLFPLLKLGLSLLHLAPFGGTWRDHPWVAFFVFRSGKWSMADVMVVAIFMAYLGFSGVMQNQLQEIERGGELEVLTTSGSTLALGFYFFLAFCLLGLLAAQRIGSRRQPPAEAQRDAEIVG